MSASLVGSEMCIRDRPCAREATTLRARGPRKGLPAQPNLNKQQHTAKPVSYTHLTLPTICSV
eukprot:10538747-Alexandrium_andersonii.AAC.1